MFVSLLSVLLKVTSAASSQGIWVVVVGGGCVIAVVVVSVSEVVVAGMVVGVVVMVVGVWVSVAGTGALDDPDVDPIVVVVILYDFDNNLSDLDPYNDVSLVIESCSPYSHLFQIICFCNTD